MPYLHSTAKSPRLRPPRQRQDWKQTVNASLRTVAPVENTTSYSSEMAADQLRAEAKALANRRPHHPW
jgi:hypothetical protein